MTKIGRPLLGSRPLTQTEKNRRHREKQKKIAAEPNARGHEWGTPPELIEAVRAVFGGAIECDPATHAAAQERVQALRYYTAEDDSLGRECQWHGKVFLNPPYQRGLIDRFIIKLMIECASRRTTQAIVLVNAQTDTQWFRYLMDTASACCFPSGRVRFLNSDGKPGMPQVGQAIFYIGTNPSRFRAVFGKFGQCLAILTAPVGQGDDRRDNDRAVDREHAEAENIVLSQREVSQKNRANHANKQNGADR